MKKLFITIGIASLAFSLYANLNGNGYYRVKNYGSNRWGTLVDDKGEIDKEATNADLHALRLTSNTEEIITDPGSIVYISKTGGNEYNIAAQGTSVNDLVGYPVYFAENGSSGGQTLYRIYGKYKGATKYIGDKRMTSAVEGTATISTLTNADYMKWFVIPVSPSSDNYFATKPDVTANGNMYTTLFTSFAYQPYSPGMKAYYVGRVGFGMVEMIEITGGVPAGTPVIIECAGPEAVDNKIELKNAQSALPGNALSGVYFDYYYNEDLKNRLLYDAATMRVLGVCADGSLGFVTSEGKDALTSVPANTAYLKVPAGSSKELRCVTTAEFDANIPEAPESITLVNAANPEDDSMVLYPQGNYNYTGSFQLPASASFNFQATIGGETVSYGPAGANVEINGNGTYPFATGSTWLWNLSGTGMVDLDIVLNLESQSVSFKSDSAGIENIVAEGGSLHFNGGYVSASNGAEIVILDLSGKTVAKSANGNLDVTGLQKGVYIAKSGTEAIKIMVN